MPTEILNSFVPGILMLEIYLKDFPEYRIPNTRLIPKLSFDDAYVNNPDVVTTTWCQHWWYRVSDTDWKIYVEIFADAIFADELRIPVYLDLDLVVLNEDTFEEINSPKA